MAEPDDSALDDMAVDEDGALTRLEAALDRIARRPPASTAPAITAPAIAAIAARLDTLIFELRAVLIEPEA